MSSEETPPAMSRAPGTSMCPPFVRTVSRTIAIPEIAQDLVRLAHAGVPIAFITGRSDAFVREQDPTAFDDVPAWVTFEEVRERGRRAAGSRSRRRT